MFTEVVISHYDKDLSWVKDFNENVEVNVITKSEEPFSEDLLYCSNNIFSVLQVKNVGRDVHTFFKKIALEGMDLHFDKISESNTTTKDRIFFFLQDYPFDHFENCIDTINSLALDTANVQIGGFYAFHYNSIGTMWKLSPSEHFNGLVLKCLSNGMPQDHNPLIDVDKYWRILFKGDPPTHYEFNPGGHFAIHWKYISIRPNKFYWKIVELLETDPVAPWIIERLELYIFDERYEIHDHYRFNG